MLVRSANWSWRKAWAMTIARALASPRAVFYVLGNGRIPYPVNLKPGAELFHHRNQQIVLAFEVVQYDLYFVFRLDVHSEIIFSTGFGVLALDILTNHDQGH